jgi:hypothetical protein
LSLSAASTIGRSFTSGLLFMTDSFDISDFCRRSPRMTMTNHAGPASLMKGHLYQSTSGAGDWRVADTLSEAGSNHENNNDESVVTKNITQGATSSEIVNGNGKKTIDFLKDDPRDMTFGRRIALSLMDKKWYNPRAGEDEDEKELSRDVQGTLPSASGGLETGPSLTTQQKHDDFDTMMHNRQPSLAKAWAYFEHVALYRYLVPQDEPEKEKKNICVRGFRKLFCKGNKKLERAEPGE